MKKSVIFVAFLALCLDIPIFANGGIPWDSVLIRDNGGKVSFKNDADIKLNSEDLKISFVDDSVIVNCEYQLFNKSDTVKNIDFAFNLTDCYGTDHRPDYYFICQDGKKIDSQLKIDVPFLDENDTFVSTLNEYSKLSLKAKDTTSVSIVYRIKTQNDGKHVVNIFNPNTFVYNLFPAMSFGDGTIDRFTVTIDKTDIAGYRGNITSVEGLDLDCSGLENIVTKTYSNFDLSAHKVLKISYSIRNWYMASMFKNDRANWNLDISVSSSLTEGSTTYKAWYLSDGNFSNPWVEGKKGEGIGEKIICKARRTMCITQIVLVNGFRKSQKTYTENCRVKKLGLYVDGNLYRTVELEDKPYEVALKSNLLETGDLLLNCTHPRDCLWLNKGQTLELQILEVYPGSKYKDTCIGELIFLSPEIPTR